MLCSQMFFKFLFQMISLEFFPSFNINEITCNLHILNFYLSCNFFPLNLMQKGSPRVLMSIVVIIWLTNYRWSIPIMSFRWSWWVGRIDVIPSAVVILQLVVNRWILSVLNVHQLNKQFRILIENGFLSFCIKRHNSS